MSTTDNAKRQVPQPPPPTSILTAGLPRPFWIKDDDLPQEKSATALHAEGIVALAIFMAAAVAVNVHAIWGAL